MFIQAWKHAHVHEHTVQSVLQANLSLSLSYHYVWMTVPRSSLPVCCFMGVFIKIIFCMYTRKGWSRPHVPSDGYCGLRLTLNRWSHTIRFNIAEQNTFHGITGMCLTTLGSCNTSTQMPVCACLHVTVTTMAKCCSQSRGAVAVVTTYLLYTNW